MAIGSVSFNGSQTVTKIFILAHAVSKAEKVFSTKNNCDPIFFVLYLAIFLRKNVIPMVFFK